MKKIVLCGITALLMASCKTEPVLVKNSRGFDSSNPSKASLDANGGKPEWVLNWADWQKQEEEKNKDRQYFLGKSLFNFSQLTNKYVYTEKEAYDEAWVDIAQQLAAYVWAEIEYSSGRTKGKQSQKTGDGEQSEKKYDVKEETFMKSYIRSSVKLEGLLTENFTEMWRQPGKQVKEITYCWVLASVPRDKVEKARIEAQKLNEKAQDEEARRKSLEGVQESKFSDLDVQYIELEGKLRTANYSIDEKSFNENYQSLMQVGAELNALDKLKGRNDGVGVKYSLVIKKVEDDIRKYNPADRQVMLIEGLNKQIEELSKALQQSSNNQSESKGGAISVQTFIMSYPSKPDEQKLKSTPAIAAEEMVSNRDFISFMSAKGINAFSRGENGLDSPAVLVSYNEAARYCNWLSKLYKLAPCYTESGGRIIGYDKKKNGYRLPDSAEIAALLDEGVINEAELAQIGIWSSESSAEGHNAYRLDSGSGTIRERLMPQSFDNEITNSEIGFRVVRNAE